MDYYHMYVSQWIGTTAEAPPAKWEYVTDTKTHTHAGNTARNVREICFFNNNGFMRGNNFSSPRFKIHNFLLYQSLFLLQKQKSPAILTNC